MDNTNTTTSETKLGVSRSCDSGFDEMSSRNCLCTECGQPTGQAARRVIALFRQQQRRTWLVCKLATMMLFVAAAIVPVDHQHFAHPSAGRGTNISATYRWQFPIKWCELIVYSYKDQHGQQIALKAGNPPYGCAVQDGVLVATVQTSGSYRAFALELRLVSLALIMATAWIVASGIVAFVTRAWVLRAFGESSSPIKCPWCSHHG